MSLYARPGKLLAKQVLSDVGTIGWVFLWGVIAIAVRRVIDVAAAPAEKMSELAGSMAGNMADAADTAESVPLVGQKLRGPFDSMSSGITEMQGFADSLAHTIHVAAIVIAVIVFVVPVIIWVWKWLPSRISFTYQSSRANRLLAADGAVELFALRAMANAPLSQLERVTSNPIHAWQTGDEAVMRQLADIELRRVGLSLPKRGRGVQRRVQED